MNVAYSTEDDKVEAKLCLVYLLISLHVVGGTTYVATPQGPFDIRMIKTYRPAGITTEECYEIVMDRIIYEKEYFD